MMKKSRLAIVVMAFATAPALAQEARPAPVLLNPTMALSPSQYARIKSFADDGMTSLRRYVWRTRAIYNYSIAELTGTRDS